MFHFKSLCGFSLATQVRVERRVGWGDFLAWDWVQMGVGLKNDHFRFGENFPSDFWGIVSDFRVGDWVLFSVRVKNPSLPVWGLSEGFPTMFRSFPEGVPAGFWEGALNRDFRGRLLSDWLSERALIRVPSGLGAYSTLFRSAHLWLVIAIFYANFFPALWLVHLYHVGEMLLSDWLFSRSPWYTTNCGAKN